jgi:hypothetical protein
MAIKRYPLDQCPFFKMGNHKKLAALLLVTPNELREVLKLGYSESDRPKKSGGTRHVENPARPLKRVQKRIAKLLSRIEPPDYLFCPVKGRSYISNAARHQGNRVVRCLDIRRYFPSTPAWRIHWFFRSIMRCENDICDTLVKLATFKGHLPTGSPLSPILSYFAFYDLWNEVAKFARERDLILSVYIDDVTLSGVHVRAKDVWEIKRLIHACGLRYHKEKIYIDGLPEITGVVVKSNALRAPHRQHQKLHLARRALLRTSDESEEAHRLRMVVKGLSQQAAQIEAQLP